MLETILTVAQYTLTFLGGIVAALVIIAPFTKTTYDDRALSLLQWVELQLRKLLPTPSPAVKEREEQIAAEKLEV